MAYTPTMYSLSSSYRNRFLWTETLTQWSDCQSLNNSWCASSGSFNSLACFFFHSNQHLDINATEYPQTAERSQPVLRGNFQWLGANTFHYLGSHCSQNGLSKWQCSARQIPKFTLFRKTAGPNHFARGHLTTNLPLKWMGWRQSVFEAFLPFLLFSSSRPPELLQVWRVCFSPLRLPWNSLWSHKKPSDSTPLLLQIYCVASLPLFPFIKINPLLMNLEYKRKSLPFLKTACIRECLGWIPSRI